MDRAARSLWGLVAVGAATAVGLTTRNPGFIAITFLGALVLPRVLGLTPRGWHGQRARAMGRHGCAGAAREAGTKDSTSASQPA